MANIENAEYEDMTDEELRSIREKMDDDTGRAGDADDGDAVGFADRPEEVR